MYAEAEMCIKWMLTEFEPWTIDGVDMLQYGVVVAVHELWS